MAKTSEAAFQAQVVELAKMYGWYVQHTRPAKVGDRWMTPIMGHVGFPDLVMAHARKGVVFAELKTHRGTMSEPQRQWFKQLQEAGAEVYLWRPGDLDSIARRLKGERQ